MEENQQSLAAGRDIIKRYLANMPHSPGVYQMLDHEGKALYVGKARHLKNRVSNYVNVAALNMRLQRMVSKTTTMEIITTRSEAEALLLEANLIKKHQPRYNILLRDDKSFPYIFIATDHAYPRIEKHRGAKTRKGKYFGPFVSASAVNETLALLQKAFLLRPCSDNIFKNRTRPCLQYQIKRCSAPCVDKISKDDYRELVSEAEAFLTGKSRAIQEKLVEEMQNESANMHFEKAAAIRDRIKALTQIQQGGDSEAHGIVDADLIALARDNNGCAIQLFSFRHGRNYGGKTWYPERAAEYSDSEILSNFIGQFYQNHAVPPVILTSHKIEESNVLEEALALLADAKVEIFCPVRGEKRKHIEQVAANALAGLLRHRQMQVTQYEAQCGVRDLFALDDVPERIEVYDNSHISGTHAVGAMIVAGREGFIKNAYRKFNMAASLNAGGDDYAMMRQMLMRRFKKLENIGTLDAVIPDVVLIDGGAGQLSAAASVFEELGIQGVTLVAISKGPDRNAGREWFHREGREPFQLDINNPVLHYLQRLRDEAHRFAIGAHRNRRSKALTESLLDDIPLIGPSRKKMLLHHFGSAKAVSSASQSDIEKVPGLSKHMAKAVFDYFNGQ